MALLARPLDLDLTKIPSESDQLRVRFDKRSFNRRPAVLVISPSSGVEIEPRTVTFATGLQLQLGDGKRVDGLGQLVVTGERVLGMVTEGTASGKQLNESVGSIYTFTLDRDDLASMGTKTNWRGKPVQVTLEFHDDNSKCAVQIFSVVASLNRDGQAIPKSLKNLLRWLSDEGREELREPLDASK